MLRRGKVEKIGWKIFDFFFPPVRIEYLHENIQGKEVKLDEDSGSITIEHDRLN